MATHNSCVRVHTPVSGAMGLSPLRPSGALAEAASRVLVTLAEEHAALLLLQDLDRLYRKAADQVRLTTGLDVVMVAPVEGESEIVLRYLAGARGHWLENIAVPSGLGLGGRVLATKQPAVVDDYVSATSITHHFDEPVRQEGLHAMVAVPILVGGVVSGVIYAALRGDGSVGDRAITTMLSISKAAGLAVDVHRQQAAVTAGRLALERRRTATDLHDSVGAMLFRIGAEVRDLRTGRTHDAFTQARLASLEERVSEASEALRQALSALRDLHEEGDDDLASSTECECRLFEERTSISARAVVLGQVRGLQSGRKQVLRRFVREALLNVEKHARASSVAVTVASIDDGVTVAVSDDGVGCSPELEGARGMGLTSVAEEIAHVGGVIDVVANDDGGTTIRARVPHL